MLGIFQGGIPSQIKEIVAQLDTKTQSLLLKELRKILLLKRAKDVDSKIRGKKIKITSAEIMKICNETRKKLHAA